MALSEKEFTEELAEEWETSPEDSLKEAEREIVYSREDINMEDALERREYVQNCLQQLYEANRELESLRLEYSSVTASLKDMDTIRGLEEEDRLELRSIAMEITDGARERDKYLERTNPMPEDAYNRILRLEQEMESGIRRLEMGQDYQRKIRNDLRRLEGEKQANQFQEEELQKIIKNMRVFLWVAAGGFLLMITALYILSKRYRLDVGIGYTLTAFLTALCVTALYIKGQDAEREAREARSKVSRLIQMQNTVKIRYVNNRNLLDYLFLKFGTEKPEELKSRYQAFQREREERRAYEKSVQALESGQKDLVYLLRAYKVVYPELWVNQTRALLDPREMVEIRHGLNERRRALREQMDYNADVVAGNARAEIEELIRDYPQYAEEISDSIGRFEDSL